MPDNPLRNLPSVAKLLETPALVAARASHPHDLIADAVRRELDGLRGAGGTNLTPDQLATRIAAQIDLESALKFRHVINATGIVLHQPRPLSAE
jgi:hypothetical protein